MRVKQNKVEILVLLLPLVKVRVHKISQVNVLRLVSQQVRLLRVIRVLQLVSKPELVLQRRERANKEQIVLRLDLRQEQTPKGVIRAELLPLVLKRAELNNKILPLLLVIMRVNKNKAKKPLRLVSKPVT